MSQHFDSSDPARKAREKMRHYNFSDEHDAVIAPDISPDWEINVGVDVDERFADRLTPSARGMYHLTGEVTVYYTDPLLYAAMVDGQKLLDEWIEDMLQERVDEEGCGATINAMREWGDDW